MGEKANLSKKFLNEVCENYELGKLVSCRKFERGEIQTNIYLKTSYGDYVLRCYSHIGYGNEKDLRSIKFEINVIKKLINEGFPVPKLFKNKFGKFISSSSEYYYVVFEYVKGQHKERKNLSEKSLESMLKNLANLHNITKGYKPNYSELREKHEKNFLKKEFKKQAKTIGTKSAQERLYYAEKTLNKIKFPNNLPKGVIHRDYNLGNILFKREKVSAVLDFDDSCYSYLAYDLASQIFFNAWFHEDPLDMKKSKKIIGIYSKFREISNAEFNNLFDMLLIVNVMHLLWSFKDFRKNNGFNFFKRRIEWLFSIGREEFTKIISNQNS